MNKEKALKNQGLEFREDIQSSNINKGDSYETKISKNKLS